jgi:hypothetical protein
MVRESVVFCWECGFVSLFSKKVNVVADKETVVNG